MRRAGSAAGEGDGMEASWDRQGGAEDPGHELVSRVAVYGRAAGVSLVLPPAVFCVGRQVRRVGVSQHAVLTLYQQVEYSFINSDCVLFCSPN